MMKSRLKSFIKFTDEYENEEDIILRDHLAMERTKLANERTLLSYIRSSLYLLLGGIALLGLKNYEDLRIVGYVSLSISGVILLIGVVRYYQLKLHLSKLYRPYQRHLEKPKKKDE